MDNTLKFIHGEEVAKVYENLQTELNELNSKYELTDALGNPRNATSYFHYSIEPTTLFFHDDIPSDLKEDAKSIFDKHLNHK